MNSIKANHEEASGFYMFTVLVILQILAVQYCFQNFQLMFCVFLLVSRNLLPRGWDRSTIFLPQGSTFFVPGAEEFALSKTFPGGLPGGLSGLEFTDT